MKNEVRQMRQASSFVRCSNRKSNGVLNQMLCLCNPHISEPNQSSFKACNSNKSNIQHWKGCLACALLTFKLSSNLVLNDPYCIISLGI